MEKKSNSHMFQMFGHMFRVGCKYLIINYFKIGAYIRLV